MTVIDHSIAVLQAIAGPFSKWSRAVLAFSILAFCIGRTYLYQAFVTPTLIDERAWVDRSLRPLWGPPFDDDEYYYAVHHPSFARIVYGCVLHARGIKELKRPLVDYTQSAEWNFEKGAYPPLRIETPLRLVNVAFLSAMVAMAYFAYKRLFANRALAVAGCLPLMFNYTIRDGASAYIGTDAMLLFWLAAFWLAWLAAQRRGTWGVFGLAVVGGFLVSTKVNGAFVLAGAALYFAVKAKGVRKLLWPLLLVVIPLGIFVALNPIYRARDFKWAFTVAKDVLRIMFQLKEASRSHDWAQFTKSEVLRESFPYWQFFLPCVAVFVAAARCRWFPVTALWALLVVLPNWLLIYIPLLRYSAPISMGFLIFFDAAAIHLALEVYRTAAARGRTVPGALEAA